MKKILSVMLALCLICSAVFMVGCSKEKTAKELVETACRKFENVDAFAAKLDYDIEMNMQGMSMTMPMTAEIKAKDVNTESSISDVNMSMEVMGQKMDMRIYMEGDYAYYDMLGVQYKASISEAEMDYSNMVNSMVAQSNYDFLDGAEVVKNDDGTMSVEVVIDEDLASEIGNAASGMASSMLGASEDMEISNLKYVYVIDKDENLLRLDLNCDVAMTVEGIAVEASLAASLSFTAFGDEVTITPPEGYLNFEEMTLE